MATHSTPRLAASTASAIAARNSWTRMLCWVQTRWSVRPAASSARRCAGVATVADQRDRADHDQHERAQRVHRQQPTDRGQRPAGGHGDRGADRGGQHPGRAEGADPHGGRPPARDARRRPPRPAGSAPGASIRRVVISRAAPAGRRCRWRRTLPGCGS